jgi:DNA-binding transcriptional MerR regulator
MVHYNSQSTCNIMGITLRQLRHWVDTGLIVPYLVEDSGNQKKYSFNFLNLIEISLVLALKQRSLSLAHIKKAVEILNKELKPTEPLTKLTLFSDGESFYALSRDPQVAFDVMRRGQSIFAVPIDELVQDVSIRINVPAKEIPQIISREKKDSNYVLIKVKF